MNHEQTIMDKVIPVKTIEYRGFSIPVFFNDDTKEFCCEFKNKVFNFGYYETGYEKDIKFMVDKELDWICTFNEYPGSRLEWFFNGSEEYRDIRLIYKNSRVLKVFIVKNENEINWISLNKIRYESEKALKKMSTLEKTKNVSDF